MKLTKDLEKQIKAINGDGSREARFTFRDKAQKITKQLSESNGMETFHEVIANTNPGTAAIIIASSILRWDRDDHRMTARQVEWAKEVFKHWTNQSPSGNSMYDFQIDRHHPVRIGDYSKEFIESTIDENSKLARTENEQEEEMSR